MMTRNDLRTRHARRLVLPAVLGLLLLAAPHVALAADGKIFPASMCVKYSGANPSYSYSSIQNPSTGSSMYVDCPMTRDLIGGVIKKGWVRVADRHSSQGVRCTMTQVRHVNGSFYVNGTSKTSSGNSALIQTLNFTPPSSWPTSSTAHYYYSCKVPARKGSVASAIWTYYLEEY